MPHVSYVVHRSDTKTVGQYDSGTVGQRDSKTVMQGTVGH